MVRWVPRNGENEDCSIVALQLACGLTYEAVLAAAVMLVPRVLERGLFWKEMQQVAAALGFVTRLRRKYDIEEDTGILHVKDKTTQHVVYLWRGRVIEPADQAMWLDPQDYLSCMKLKAGSLLVVEGQK